MTVVVPRAALTFVLLAVLVLGQVIPSRSVTSTAQLVQAPLPLDPSVHRTYRLNGSGSSGWNNTVPGLQLNASDGDIVTLILHSVDAPTPAPHNWFLDFNNNYLVNPNEKPTESPDFNSTTELAGGLNFTFTASLANTPHGGVFTYRCLYHANMFGNFKFTAGPVASFTHSPSTPLAGNLVSFDASSSWWSTDATSLTSYTWDFGDTVRTNTTSSTVTHTYSSPGNYTVSLNVTDNLSQQASTARTVDIKPVPPIPFNYTLTITPSALTLIQGLWGAVTITVTLTSGTAENVTLSPVVSPSSSIEAVLARTSGFPTYSSTLNITSTTQTGNYTITVMAISSTGVAHNATFLLTVKHLPPPICNCPLLYLGPVAAIAAAIGIPAIFVFFRRSRKKRLAPESLSST